LKMVFSGICRVHDDFLKRNEKRIAVVVAFCRRRRDGFGF
jgi:hypothetical protein